MVMEMEGEVMEAEMMEEVIEEVMEMMEEVLEMVEVMEAEISWRLPQPCPHMYPPPDQAPQAEPQEGRGPLCPALPLPDSPLRCLPGDPRLCSPWGPSALQPLGQVCPGPQRRGPVLREGPAGRAWKHREVVRCCGRGSVQPHPTCSYIGPWMQVHVEPSRLLADQGTDANCAGLGVQRWR